MFNDPELNALAMPAGALHSVLACLSFQQRLWTKDDVSEMSVCHAQSASARRPLHAVVSTLTGLENFVKLNEAST